MFLLASFVHRDLVAWRDHLNAHMEWLYDQERAGAVAASGPITDTIDSPDTTLAAMILIRAADRDTAQAILDTDPFVVHGVTEDLVVRGWNPFIGAFAAETTPPPQLDAILAER